MSNVMLKLSANKTELYRKQRIVGRLGDGDLTTIDIYLLQEDGYSPYILTDDMILTFKGNLANGEYTEGPIIIQNMQEGFCQYTFSKENFSAMKKYKRAYIELFDASGSTTTFQDFQVDVIPNADLSKGQVQLYVSKLDTLLKEFSESYNQFVLEKESSFQGFLEEKELQYQEVYNQYNDLVRRLNESDQRMTSIEKDQDTIIRLISENNVATKIDLEQAKQESSANVIYQIVGKDEVEMTLAIDLKGKISGSKVENPNKVTLANRKSLPVPPTGTELVDDSSRWNSYPKIFDLDGNVLTATETAVDVMPSMLFEGDVLNSYKRELGEHFFIDRGAATDKECMAILRQLVKSFKYNVHGYGKGPSGNQLTTTIWNGTGGNWSSGTYRNSSSNVSRITRTMSTVQEINGFLNDDGLSYVIAYAEASDGNVQSAINVDYINLEITIKLSMNEHIKSMMAAFSGKNSVSLSEPQTVEGLKNFSDGVQSNGIDVTTQDMTKVTLFQSTELSNVKGTTAGIVWPIDEVAIVFGGVGAHARRGGTSEPGTIYFNEAGKYLIELLWFVNSGTATRKYVYMDWIKHGTTDLLFRSGIGKINGFSYTSSVPGGGIITMGKDEGVDILLKSNVEDLIAGVRIYYIKITKIG